MIATQTITPLNPVQRHILEMFSFCRSEQTIDDLKEILAAFYADKVQKEADRLWDDGVLNNAAIDNLLNEHLRTPYNHQ
ncbi:MAG: hypothetical protein IKR94_02895 [Bacteroidales bacterium]|nr:hypothetical protein [Bacteroidales bacterium]